MAPGSLAGASVVLTGREGHHAATVRRLTAGERADVSDGAGVIAECVVTAHRPDGLELAVVARHVTPPPQPELVVAQGLPKGDRGPLAVELMTEAGVDVIMPWQAQRCVTQWRAERAGRALERWRGSAREAAKQSRRAWLPEVTDPVSSAGLAAAAGRARLAVLLDPGAAQPLSALRVPDSGQVMLIVGPEGGVTGEETRLLTAAGAVRARLGPTVLRTSSAGMAAAVVVLSQSARWNGGAAPR